MNVSKNQDQITVLMPVYNGSLYIEEQIHSIMSQTYDNIRLIIRDNASTDGTAEIVLTLTEKYSNIIFLKTLNNEGIIGNVSALVEYALESPYVMLADCDDVWLPNKIALTKQKMDQLESQYGVAFPCLVHSDLKVVDRELELLHPSFWSYTYLDPKRSNFKYILNQNVVTGCTMMMNQPLVRLARPIPSKALMHDWWIALVAAAFGKIAFTEEAPIFYRQHGSNDTGAAKYRFPAYLAPRKFHRKSQIIAQTREFFCRYHSQLNDEQNKILQFFLAFKESKGIVKLFLMWKHGFTKTGLLRNLKELIT